MFAFLASLLISLLILGVILWVASLTLDILDMMIPFGFPPESKPIVLTILALLGLMGILGRGYFPW